jgi:hypothetical protein
MNWNEIPNDVARSWSGRTIRHQLRDGDYDPVFKLMACPGDECEFHTANMEAMSDHIVLEHDAATGKRRFSSNPELVDSQASDLIMTLLSRLNTSDPEDPLRAVRKTNDAHHATEVWRRVSLAVERAGHIQLKEAQYAWLGNVLTRKLAITQTEGESQRTVADEIWALNADNVAQALKTLEDRRVPDPDEDEDDPGTPSANGTSPGSKLGKTVASTAE